MSAMNTIEGFREWLDKQDVMLTPSCGFESLEADFAFLAVCAAMPKWIRCEDEMPKSGVPIIAFIPAFGGGTKSRRIRAQYAADKTLEQSVDADGGVYDEATDTYYCEEGWYETNEYEEVHWAVSNKVTHWMPLPEIPEVVA